MADRTKAIYTCEVDREVRDRVISKFSTDGATVAPFIRTMFDMLDVMTVSESFGFLTDLQRDCAKLAKKGR